ncbi:MAG TPA: nucleoid occlusion factor SlmA [Pseudomonadales bacterium]|jgi:TetR/AcrR family transcriptional regulator
MAPARRNPARRQQILETLARMLEERSGERITTAQLAAQVGVSEAALYRHFPSKTRMFEDLIAFVEESVFTRVSRILADNPHCDARLQQVIALLLGFSERNPGISRLMTGEALAGEDERLRHRINQLHDRIELTFRQILKDGERDHGLRSRQPVNVTAQLLLALTLGKILRFAQSGFRDKPAIDWPDQWQLVVHGLFRDQA